ncbi:unnamed protein product [Paramecium primaurelia]|uniref:Uncharacterized protein n=1 Tax=Paramecium primaurelia TaxID=5886 RepID=A0A8S1LSJ7_PARPR|nr:unnamed protein product [Paramecium primaurelia]
MKIKKQKNHRSKYQSINSSERELIIQYIKEYKYSTSHVSMITGHNISTIKAIYKVYKNEGRVQKKDKRDKILNVVSQVQIFMVDEIKQSLANIGEEITEYKGLKDNDHYVREQTEQMIKQLLQKKQFQILSKLSNQQAIEIFKTEMNSFFQQKSLTNDFSIITPSSLQQFLERQQIKFSRNKNQEKYSDITQVPLISNKFLSSDILILLDEQHKLMKTQN